MCLSKSTVVSSDAQECNTNSVFFFNSAGFRCCFSFIGCFYKMWEVDIIKSEEFIMNTERKYIREVVKKSLTTQFEKIVSEAKLTEQEEAVVRMIIIRKASVVETSLKLNISESTVYRTMREFYERANVILAS